jgi:segregation and condensation protein B
VSNKDHMRLLEALLFASATPLSTRELHERMPEDADVGGCLMELQKHYEGRGVVLTDMDGNWAFRTATDLGDALQIEKDVQRKLSRAAMETLAIVAYHQPITRAEIENIRGVATHKGTLDALMEAGWVRPGKRRNTPGRPLTWVTTSVFLDQFSLESVMDLPGMDDLKASGLLDRRPAIEATPNGSGDLFEGLEDEALAEGAEGEYDNDNDFEFEEDSDAEDDEEEFEDEEQEALAS